MPMSVLVTFCVVLGGCRSARVLRSISLCYSRKVCGARLVPVLEHLHKGAEEAEGEVEGEEVENAAETDAHDGWIAQDAHGHDGQAGLALLPGECGEQTDAAEDVDELVCRRAACESRCCAMRGYPDSTHQRTACRVPPE